MRPQKKPEGTLARRLHQARERAGLSRREAAERADLSVHYWDRLERGERDNPTAEVLIAIAGVLKVSADYLLGLRAKP